MGNLDKKAVGAISKQVADAVLGHPLDDVDYLVILPVLRQFAERHAEAETRYADVLHGAKRRRNMATEHIRAFLSGVGEDDVAKLLTASELHGRLHVARYMKEAYEIELVVCDLENKDPTAAKEHLSLRSSRLAELDARWSALIPCEPEKGVPSALRL